MPRCRRSIARWRSRTWGRPSMRTASAASCSSKPPTRRPDTDNMLEQARRDPRVRGVVGWAGLGARPDAFAEQLGALRRQPAIVGLRNLMHVKGTRGWILGDHQVENVAQVARAGLALDVVTSAHDEISDIVRLRDRVADLRIVLDHLGKPPVGGSAQERRECGRPSPMSPPTSGASPSSRVCRRRWGPLDAWTPAQWCPVHRRRARCLRPEPADVRRGLAVVILAGGYERAWSAIDDAISSLGEDERAAVLGATAARVYGL